MSECIACGHAAERGEYCDACRKLLRHVTPNELAQVTAWIRATIRSLLDDESALHIDDGQAK